MKRCTHCGIKKPISAFYEPFKRGFVDPRCKECKRKISKEWRSKNRLKHRASVKQWRKDNRDAFNEWRRATRAKKAQQTSAHNKLTKAVRAGRVVKPDACQDCGTAMVGRLIQGHHHDYSKPLDVVWLCAQCHLKAHGVEVRS